MTTRHDPEALARLDPSLLRAVLRERTHHSLEYHLYRGLFGNMSVSRQLGAKVEDVLRICLARGISLQLPDVGWSARLVELAKALRSGERPDISGQRPTPFEERDRQVVDRLLFERRSIRSWSSNPVPPHLVERVIEAGLWAPHACNLQTVRVIIVHGPTAAELLPMGETRGAAVYLVICQDMRIYEMYKDSVPEHNRGLDCGAAVQNMLLMAQAQGLGAVWGTFDDRVSGRIRRHFDVPSHIHLVTYVALGWPAESHLPPGRIAVSDAVVAEG